jgi:hypothetical protein
MSMLEQALNQYGQGVRFIPSAKLRATAGREVVQLNQQRMERGSRKSTYSERATNGGLKWAADSPTDL